MRNRKKYRKSRGYAIGWVLMCSALMMMLFLLSMDMFVMAGRSTSKISASVDAGKSAGERPSGPR